jgi:phospholipid-binding lipoprotein MlaA
MKRILTLAGLILLSGCATAPGNSDDPFDVRDPIKPVNQEIFSFNLFVDQWLIKPVTTAYHQIPDWGRAGISNFVTNLSEPSNTVNGALQLNPKIAFTSFWRFTLNSTFGLGGLRDFAEENGLKYQDQDFGKTLGSYGVDDGAYVVLPLAGPSTVRDTTGKVVDWFMDPVGWFLTTPEIIAQICTDGITTRDEQSAIIEQFYYQSLEPYSATRAAYLQHEAFQ